MNVSRLCEWEIIGRDKDENIIHYYKSPNLQVDTGKAASLNWIGGLSNIAASGFTFLGYGPSSFTAAVTDTGLGGISGGVGYEYIGNPGGRPAITNWVQTAENYVYSGLTFTQKLTGSITINGSTDPNANSIGAPIQSFALFNTYTLPSAPNLLSGVMFNELVDATQFLLKNGVDFNTLSVTIVLRE